MKNREPTIEGDIAYVPLGIEAKNGHAKICHADYNYLLGRGISGNWTLSNGYVVVSVQGKVAEKVLTAKHGLTKGHLFKEPNYGVRFDQGKPRQEYVARLLLNAKDEEIRYGDGDRTNLLRENLSKHPRDFGTYDASKSFPYLGYEAATDPTGLSLKALSSHVLDPNNGMFKKCIRKPHPPLKDQSR